MEMDAGGAQKAQIKTGIMGNNRRYIAVDKGQ